MADGNLGVIYYEVEAKTAALVQAEREATSSLNKLEGGMKSVDVTAKTTDFQLKKTSAEIKRMGDGGALAAGQLNALKAVLGGLIAVQTAKGVLDLVEGYNEMADRVQLATSSLEEYEFVQSRMLKIANATERDMKEAQELYLGTADALKEMGYTTEQVIDIGDSLSHSFAANAAAADVADSAIRALSKAMVTGKVSAQQWISLEAAAPNIIADIAASSGKATAEIRRMGAEGKVSAKMLSDGLLQARDRNQALDESMSQTVAGSMKRITNSFAAYAGELNRSTGATQVITGAMSSFAENIDGVATAIGITVSAALGRYIALTGQSLIASASAAMAARAKAIEYLNVAKANEAAAAAALKHATANKALGGSHAAAATAARNHATAAAALNTAQQAVVSVGSRLLGVLGGPVGIVAMLASAGAAMMTMSKNSKEAKHDIDLLTGSIDKLGDANLRLLKIRLTEKIDEMRSLGGEAAKSTARIETLNKNLQETSSSNPNHAAWQREIAELQATVENATSELGAYEEQLEKINELERKIAADSRNNYRDPDADRRLQDMRDELALVKLQGEARARLHAIQKLGDNATEEQKKEAEELAAQIYRIEEARKKANESNKKGLKESEQAAKENAKAVSDLTTELKQATLEGKALAEAQALAKLNKFATPDDIARVKALAGAIYELELAEQNRQLLAEMDPVEAERQRFEEQLGGLKRLHDAKLIEDQRYYDLKEGMEREHIERMRLAEEERFEAQNWQNELLIKSLNSLEQASANALTGLISGANNSTQAIQQLAAGISQELIGSLVKMGMEQVKAWAMGKVAQSAAAAGYATSVQGQVAANTALAAQAAFASTAAIPITGPAMAPAAAAAAASAAGSLGAPAIAASALTMAGARFYGGPVEGGGKMYRINEGGAPEILNTADGKQYLLPNSRGQVVSNRDATGGTQVNVSVVINSDGSMSAGANPAAWAERGREVGEFFRSIVKDELYKSNSAGGMLRANHYG